MVEEGNWDTGRKRSWRRGKRSPARPLLREANKESALASEGDGSTIVGERVALESGVGVEASASGGAAVVRDMLVAGDEKGRLIVSKLLGVN